MSCVVDRTCEAIADLSLDVPGAPVVLESVVAAMLAAGIEFVPSLAECAALSAASGNNPSETAQSGASVHLNSLLGLV